MSDFQKVRACIDELIRIEEGMSPNDIWRLFLISKEIMFHLMVLHHRAVAETVKNVKDEGKAIVDFTNKLWESAVQTTTTHIKVGSLMVDIAHQTVHTATGEAVELTQVEFKTLMALMKTPGNVISRNEILEEIGPHTSELRMVDTYVSRLRQKLGKDTIECIRGVGYKIAG